MVGTPQKTNMNCSRWTTKRRFQEGGSCCLLGCSEPNQEDSVEHYLRCPLVLGVARSRLRIHFHNVDPLHCMLLAVVPQGIQNVDSWIMRCAVMLYAIYTVRNNAQFQTQGPFTPTTARQALKQAIYEGVRGHTRAMRTVDSVYAA